MSTVSEIESALKELPLQQAQEIALWLDNYICQQASSENAARSEALNLPDYAARRRMVFGGQVLPNMVLVSRDE